MHFLFTAPRYHTNQHFAVKALLDAGHQVTFMALGLGQSEVYDSLSPTVLADSATMHAIGIQLPPLFEFWGLIQRLKPDVVVVRDPNTTYGLLSIATARVMRRTVVFYSQTLMHRNLRWCERFIRSFPAWVAGAKWITPVLGSPDAYSPAIGALRYVPFVMEPQTAPVQKQWFHGGVINVLSVGKFQRRKNHRMFLRVVARLLERYPIRATIIGECTTEEHKIELAEVRKLHQDLGLGDRVRFQINMPFHFVQQEYAKHDLFVLPSRDEPAAVSHLEAMSHSLPAICSDTNGTQCYIRPGENGYVFRTDDLDHLVECMERIISDRARLVEMGARSYELVISEHSPAKYVNKLVAIAEGRG